MNKLSVVMNEFNEEKKLPKAINSVKKIADEIVVIDLGSTDDTAEIAKKLGAKVYFHENPGYVEPTRNYGIEKAVNEWILVIDSDEEVSIGLAQKLKEILKNPTADYYRIPRKNIVFGKWLKYSRWWPDYNIRFFRKGSVSWNEVIHAVPMTIGKGADLEVDGEASLIHHNYQTLDDYIDRMVRYTKVQSQDKIKSGYEFHWQDLISKPFDEFVSRYFFGKGYLDGVHGLAVALLQSASELILYLRIWEKQNFNDKTVQLNEIVTEMKKKERDLHYWQADAKYNESNFFLDRVRRKLRI